MNNLMKDKRGLVMGVANDKSIGWGIAKAIADQGGELAFTYQGEALRKRVIPLADSVNSDIVLPCDVPNDEDIDNTFNELKKKWPKIDFLVHAIAFSDKDELKGEYIDTSRENFLNTMDISVYSFTAIARRAAIMMPNGGSLLTLSYYGAEKVMPHYNAVSYTHLTLPTTPYV